MELDAAMSDSSAEEESRIGGQPAHAYVSGLFSDVIGALHAANQMPQGDDYEFYRSFRGFPKEMTNYTAALTGMLDEVAAACTKGLATDGTPTEAVSELVESLFENIDDDLDIVRAEAGGRKRSAEEQIRRKQLLRAASQTTRPQNSFRRQLDNSTAPFRPFTHVDADNIRCAPPGTWPYENEIKTHRVADWQLLLPNPATPSFVPADPATLTYIDKPAQLEKLRSVLLAEKEFAVDLEHHNLHSFQGFTCLMQVSTRTADFVVDCLALRHHMYVLLPAFINPNIMKVFHGAGSDIEWLQRDFGIYIVNLFDTGIAARQLNIPAGLGKLLASFGINVDKKYQTADWRQRPLSVEMLKYAREDTHYLLPLADHLRTKLLQQEGKGAVVNPLQHVYDESRALCLRRYVKPSLEDDEFRMMGRIDEGVRKRHSAALHTILRWRDFVARQEDESYPAILPHATCISLAQELASIDISRGSICRLFTPVPRFLQKHIGHLVTMLQQDKVGPVTTAPAPVQPVKESRTTAELIEEVEWDVENDDNDLWAVDNALVQVVRNEPSALYQALTSYVDRNSKDTIVKHFARQRAEVTAKREAKRKLNEEAVATLATQAAPQPQVAPVMSNVEGLGQTLATGGGDFVNLQSGKASKVKATPAQTSSHPVAGSKDAVASGVVAAGDNEGDMLSLSARKQKEKKQKRAADKSEKAAKEAAATGSAGSSAGSTGEPAVKASRKARKSEKRPPLPHEEHASMPDAAGNQFLQNIGWE
ncbi:Protein RRP6-like 2, partial [Diplonema papillatum]